MKETCWRQVEIGDLVDSISETHSFKIPKIILINTSDVYDGKVLNHKYVPNKRLRGQFKKSFQKHDILYSEIRPQNKRFAYIDFNAQDYVASTKLMVLRKKSPYILSSFLFQVLKSNNIIKTLQVIAESRSGTFPQITFAELARLQILLPPLSEQKAIADTLSCLDDKIELNNRINKTLEEMAQAIFKSWFVDFEPFQDGEFEDSELGPIPKGWRVESLDSVADFLNGLAMQKYRPDTEESLPVIKIKELNQGYTDNTSDRASINIPEQYIINNGDVVFSWSGTLMVKIWTGGQGGLNQHLFKVTSRNYEKWFYYLWTLEHLTIFRAIAKDRATTMGHIKRGHLTQAKVLVPTESVMKGLSEILIPIFDYIVQISMQSSTLKELRDTLLPKLISGEIRVPIEEVQ